MFARVQDGDIDDVVVFEGATVGGIFSITDVDIIGNTIHEVVLTASLLIAAAGS